MSKDKMTKERLLREAKKEFMDKGFAKASLRKICLNAEVTTGALYFFFQDKEDLFYELVREPIEELRELMHDHYMKESSEVADIMNSNGTYIHDVSMVPQIIEVLYDHFDEIYMILERSEGSALENMIAEFVDLTEAHSRRLAAKYAEASGTEKIDDTMIHWIAHLQIESFTYLIEHKIEKEKAIPYAKSMATFLASGWVGLFQQEEK